MKERSMLIGGIFFIMAFHAGPVFAAVDAARLTFQKTIVADDKAEAYVIKKGDTIARIIRKHRGKASLPYEAIKQLNPHIADLNRIYPGQKLVLPKKETQPSEEIGQIESAKDYTVKKGDSITRIILYELKAAAPDVLNKLRVIKQLNPEIENWNRISPGQVLKLPDGKIAAEGKEVSASTPAAPTVEKTAAAVQTVVSKEKHLSLITQIIKQLNGTVITTGQYYIPLSQSGQATIDCAMIPVVELDDGTTVLLDFAARLPDALADMIRLNWQNYHFVKIDKGDGIATVLQKIMRASQSYTMAKMDKPLSWGDEPRVQLSLDWLITKKGQTGNVADNLGLIFTAEKSRHLPAPFWAYAKKKGLSLCEITDDEAHMGGQAAVPYALTIPQIGGGTHDELLFNFLALLGFSPLKDKEVKIFDAVRNGFDLSIKADLLVKAKTKTVLFHKSNLPQQFIDVLKEEGTEAFYLSPQMPQKTLLENTLSSLDIPFLSARFSLPQQDEKTKFNISFSAVKVAGNTEFYLIDFAMEEEIGVLVMKNWRVNIVRY